MQAVISVVVPIYNVEKYLHRCVDSIINQTYKNLEIILVDDGSLDSCPKICDDYSKKDNRIKVIHKKNGGLSDARNAGMKIAKGEYISFVDSDDWIEHEMMERLYEVMVETNGDIASCGVRMVWDDNTPSKMLTKSNGKFVLDSCEKAMDSLISAEIIQTVWNKLYKTEIVKKILFPYGKINEDEFWTWQVVAASNKVVSIDIPLYNYFQRAGSIMQGGNSFNPYLVLEAKCSRYEYIEKHFPRLKDKCCVDLLYTCLYQAQRTKLLLPKNKSKESIDKISKIVKQHQPNNDFLKTLNIKKRLRIKSIYYNFKTICTIQSLLGIGNKSNI